MPGGPTDGSDSGPRAPVRPRLIRQREAARAVPGDAQRHEDRQQDQAPEDRGEDRVLQRPVVRGLVVGRDVAEQLAHGCGHRADRVPCGHRLQPGGHGLQRDERVGHEGQREQPDEPGGLGHLHAAHRQADDGADPQERVREQRQQGEPAEHADGRGVSPPADQEPGQGHGRRGDPGEREVGERAPREHRGPGHRQRAEPVEQPPGQVVGHRDAGRGAGEGHGLHEDPAHEVVGVVPTAGHLDRAAEDEREQQHEHDRLDDPEDDRVRLTAQARDVAPGDGPGVGQGLAQGAHRAGPLPRVGARWACGGRRGAVAVGAADWARRGVGVPRRPRRGAR